MKKCPSLPMPFSWPSKRFTKPTIPISSSKKVDEIRVCTNRTCRRQGSVDILLVLSGISPFRVSVNSSGCLGHCGAGPNVVLVPQGLLVSHCGTPSKAAHLMVSLVCDEEEEVDIKGSECLEALALRKRGEDEMAKGNPHEALILLSQAIHLKPIGGVHIMYRCRSAARLVTGDKSGALEDAKEALSHAPKYAEGYVSQGDAFIAMDQIDDAENSYAMALYLEPSLRRSKAFKARLTVLEQKLTPTNPA